MVDKNFSSVDLLGNDWTSFWKLGSGKNILRNLIRKAETTITSLDQKNATEILTTFADSHQYFPVSLTDGTPLAYGYNVQELFDGRLLSVIDNYNKLPSREVNQAEKQTLISKLYYLIGDYLAADKTARLAIARNKNSAPAYYQLARVARASSSPKNALKYLSIAVELAPNEAEYHYAFGEFLQICMFDEKAVAAFNQAIKLKSNYGQAYHGLCWSLRRLGRIDESIKVGQKAVSLNPNSHTFYHLIYSMLAAGKNKTALVKCYEALKQNPMNPAALALLSTALYETGKHDEARDICNFENLLKVIDIVPPSGYPDLKSFNAALAKTALASPLRIMDPTQTKNLFLSRSGPFADFKAIINNAVEKYYRSFSPALTHPFLSHPMKKWCVDGWATRLKKMGEQEHHFHNHAWLSGVYYVQLPAAVGGAGSQDGYIEFCRFRSYSSPSSEAEVVTLKPEEGMMILFPSYFYHRILPFNDDKYRISIAFNFIPEG